MTDIAPDPDLRLPDGVFTEAVVLTDLERAVGPWPSWARQCHALSLGIVTSGLLRGPARVARGAASRVHGQHSWIVLGEDCYDPRAQILDPTLWSYDAARSPLLLHTDASHGTHRPHGAGFIFDHGKPASHGGEPIDIDRAGLSRLGRRFLDLLGPLDVHGWYDLLHSPVGGWPAGEIIAASYRDKRLRALIPIDIVGMTTDLNPGGLYR